MRLPRFYPSSSLTTLPWRNIWVKSGSTVQSSFNTLKRMAPSARFSSLRSPSDLSLHSVKSVRRLSQLLSPNSTGPSSWLSPEELSPKEVGNSFQAYFMAAPFYWFPVIYNSRLIGKRDSTQQRPRSRTLTSVHEAILEDIVKYTFKLANTFVNIGVPCYHYWKVHQSDPWWKEAHQS